MILVIVASPKTFLYPLMYRMNYIQFRKNQLIEVEVKMRSEDEQFELKMMMEIDTLI